MLLLKTTLSIDDDIVSLSSALTSPKGLYPALRKISNPSSSAANKEEALAVFDTALTSLRKAVLNIFKEVGVKWNVEVKGSCYYRRMLCIIPCLAGNLCCFDPDLIRLLVNR